MPMPVSVEAELDERAVVGARRFDGLDRHRAAVRHRVARVDREVDDHLLDLRRVGLHRREARARASSTSSTSSPIRRRSRLSMSATTALRSSTRGCSTCRRLNASSWRVSAAARADAFLISSAWRRSRASSMPLDQELAVAEDHGQQVVEVVGDAAGEAADRLHLLRLAELLLELLLARKVAHDRDVTAGADVGGRDELDLAQAAVRALERRLRLHGAFAHEPGPEDVAECEIGHQVVDASTSAPPRGRLRGRRVRSRSARRAAARRRRSASGRPTARTRRRRSSSASRRSRDVLDERDDVRRSRRRARR